MPTIVWYVLIFIIASVWVAFFHSFHSSQCAILVINRRFLRLIFDWVRNWMILYIEKSQATHFFSSSIQFFSYIFFFCYLRWKSIHFVNDADTQTMNNILVCCISKWISFIFVVVVVEQYFLPRIWMEIGIFTVYTVHHNELQFLNDVQHVRQSNLSPAHTNMLAIINLWYNL